MSIRTGRPVITRIARSASNKPAINLVLDADAAYNLLSWLKLRAKDSVYYDPKTRGQVYDLRLVESTIDNLQNQIEKGLV